MLFRTHALFGIFCYFILEYFIEMPFFVFFGVLLGSIFVDLDSNKSKVGRRLKILSWLFVHRGLIHSFFACFVLSAVVGALNLWLGFGFFVGYLSHLILDSFTPRGLKLFWPFGFRIRGFIKSGSWIEDVLFVLFLILSICLFLICCFR